MVLQLPEKSALTQVLRLLRTNIPRKLENLKAAVALHFAYYNFCHVHYDFENYYRDGSWNRRSCVEQWGTIHEFLMSGARFA